MNKTNANKTINIIIPIYKAESFMDRCIESVLNQTYKNLHVILVDDKSPDASGVKCEEWKKKDQRISVIHHEVNKGAGAARNSGLNYLMDDDGYIAFVDADDFLHPKYFEYLYQTLEKENADIVWCDVHNTFEKVKLDYFDVDFSNVKTYSLSGHDLLLREDLRIMYCMVWGKLYKSHIWRNVRFAEDYNYYEDGATTFKAIYEAKKVVISDAKLYNYFYSADSATRSETSEIKLRDGLRTEVDKIVFYSQKNEQDLVDMAYVAYLTTILKVMRESKKIRNRNLYKEMRKLYKENYLKAVSNNNLAVSQKIKFVVYRFFPNIQNVWINIKMRFQQ